mgnify:CR=1 FL=1
MLDPAQALLDSPVLPRYLDRLRRVLDDEAVRRAQFVDDLSPEQKAEFINGEVVVHSPARHRHNLITSRTVGLLGAYVRYHDLGEVVAEKALVSLTRNDYEPDVCFFRKEVAESFTPDQWQFPAPDFIAEVLSESTEKHDRGVKFEDYAAHRVGEYWLLDPLKQRAEFYSLGNDGLYQPLQPENGALHSRVLTGFTLQLSWLWSNPLPPLLDVLRECGVLA